MWETFCPKEKMSNEHLCDCDIVTEGSRFSEPIGHPDVFVLSHD